jgi:aspartate/methionine/tyrosine aminotransferase
VRLDFSQPENALSRALRDRRAPVIDLTESNPTAVRLPQLQSVLPAAPLYSPQPRGLLEARAAAAAVHGAEGDQAILCASTSEAYSWLFKLLCDPGDEVLVPQPCYPLLDDLCALESVRMVPYALRWDGEWHLDTAALRFSPRARAVLVVNPGNPTGAYLKAEERDALASACARNGCALISDEVFCEFPAGEDARRVRTVAGHGDVLSFALSGLSKLCGLPQLKLGWMIASGPGGAEALARLERIGDSYLSVGTPVQLAAPALIAGRDEFQRPVRERLARNRAALLMARSPAAPWDVLRSEGGWSAVLSVPRARSEEEWALRLLDEGVLVHPGYFFDFPHGAHLVVSLLPAEETFARAAGVLARVLSSP